jgi:Zn-dependent protease
MSLPGFSGRTVKVATLGGVPISASPSYLLTTSLFVLHDGLSWHDPYLTIAMTIALVVHEMGHALVAKANHLQPEVELHLLGGLCKHRGTSDHAVLRRVIAAGPLAGFALALVAWPLGQLLTVMNAPLGLSFTVNWLATISFVWSIVNALPIWPMDGGQFYEYSLRSTHTALRARHRAHVLGRAIGAGATVLAPLVGHPEVVLVTLPLALYNHARLQSTSEA